MTPREELEALRRLAELEGKAAPTVASEYGPLEAGVIAAGRWFDQKATGLREATPAPLRRGIDWVGEKLGMEQPPSIDPKDMAATDAAFAQLAKQHPKSTFAGEMAPNLMLANPLAFAGVAAMDPGTAGERALRAGTAYAAGKAGEFVGGKIAGVLGKRAAGKAAERSAAQNTNAVRDATIREAQAAGYTLPPTQVNPTLRNRTLEGLSGKIMTAQAAAVKNEPITQALAKKALSIPDDVPLTAESIKGVRSIAGQVYEQAKRLGPMQADDAYRDAVSKVLAEYRALAAEFPSQGSKLIDDLAADLEKQTFSSAGVINLVKRLRHDGFKNLRAAADPEKALLGRVQLGAQEALEDLVERNMSGNGMLLEAFKRARQLIAKSHAVETAFEESTGKVVASKLGRQFSSGRPLSGELATIGKTAEAFPRALQNVNSSMAGISPLDFMAGLLTNTATVFTRPAVRSAILSGPYQRGLLSDYAPSTAERLLALAGRHPDELRQLGGLLGGIGGLQAGR